MFWNEATAFEGLTRGGRYGSVHVHMDCNAPATFAPAGTAGRGVVSSALLLGTLLLTIGSLPLPTRIHSAG
jgi:hypothetical protein